MMMIYRRKVIEKKAIFIYNSMIDLIKKQLFPLVVWVTGAMLIYIYWTILVGPFWWWFYKSHYYDCCVTVAMQSVSQTVLMMIYALVKVCSLELEHDSGTIRFECTLTHSRTVVLCCASQHAQALEAMWPVVAWLVTPN